MAGFEFDGKPCDKQFIDALTNRGKEVVSEFVYFRLTDFPKMRFELRVSKFSFTDFEVFEMPIMFTDDKIDYDKTISSIFTKVCVVAFEDGTKDLRQSIDHYDEYKKVTVSLQKAFNKWCKLPQHFRDNFYTKYMKIN